MPFKDILVHVDLSRHCETRLDFAAALAVAHQAHLIGLFVRTAPRIPQFVRAQFGPDVLALQKRYADEATAQAAALFERRVGKAGVACEWRAGDGELYDVVAMHARYADLTLVGHGGVNGESEAALADHLVLDAGRPVLVVPPRPHSGSLERVLVAWNASREATRAVNDALPLLRAAKKVVVLAVNPVGGPDGHGAVPGADLSLHLARHGVNAEAEAIEADDVGRALLARAAERGADALVMGAYGRSRVRELVLGGATRYVLDHAEIPVLMSH